MSCHAVVDRSEWVKAGDPFQRGQALKRRAGRGGVPNRRRQGRHLYAALRRAVPASAGDLRQDRNSTRVLPVAPSLPEDSTLSSKFHFKGAVSGIYCIQGLVGEAVEKLLP